MNQPIKANTFWTLNLEVAAMMTALGFQFKKDQPGCKTIDGQGRPRYMMFMESECDSEDFGKLRAGKVLGAWKAAGEGETDPLKSENPAAYAVIEYMAVAAKNRLAILHTWKTCAPLMLEQKVDGNTLNVPADASPDLIRRVQAMIADS